MQSRNRDFSFFKIYDIIAYSKHFFGEDEVV